MRFSQKGKDFPLLVQEMIEGMGFRAWTYREGKKRDVYVVEFSKTILSHVRLESGSEIIDYVRGYFDAEGGVPRDVESYPYIYFAQKNRQDLDQLRSFLECLGIGCGKIHNPSVKDDPDYWRFYVKISSLSRFSKTIGSFHPRKKHIVESYSGLS